MATRMSEVVQHLRKSLLLRDGAGLTDGQLLERFIEQGEEAAVAALVRRHAPMVWGVCRRVLDDHHDAEDAFQAAFLVLVRRAATIVPRERVGNWLYGVAHQTALKARATLAKQRTREKSVAVLPEISIESQQDRHELQLILDQELSRLPSKYRVAIVLCDLEGRSRTEAARQLGVPPGTLASQLTRGRALLAKRLIRQGVTVCGGMLAALAGQASSACPPVSVMASTIKAVTTVAAGQAASAVTISAQTVALSEGMVKTMMMSKFKMTVGILLVLTVSMAGGVLYTTRADDPPRVEQKRVEDLRAAALKTLEQFGKSEQASDREAALQALVDLRREIKAAEAARRQHPARAVEVLAERFKYRVPIETGATEFKEGGHIDILEVWGTRPQIEVGGQYLVRGKYKLPPGQRGRIYFFRTESALSITDLQFRALAGGGTSTRGFPIDLRSSVATLDLQSVAVDKQEGEFTVVHGMLGDGHFHLILTDPERYSRMFANVYFGTGKNVWRKKSG